VEGGRAFILRLMECIFKRCFYYSHY